MTNFQKARGAMASWLGVVAMLFFVWVSDAHAQPIRRVYRADWRTPSEMFQQGASGSGNNLDLLAHALGGSCVDPDPIRGSAWVSTVDRFAQARTFAQDQLSAAGATGPDRVMWIYTIRPDHTYLSIPGILGRVALLGRANMAPYTPRHAADIDYLLQNTLIVPEEEVVTHFISPENIESAIPMYIERNQWRVGTRVANPRYIDFPTSVDVDGDFDLLVPPASIHTGYPRPAVASAPPSCAMSCDRANATTSLRALDTSTGATLSCSAATLRKGRATPLVRNLPFILDFFGEDKRNEEL